MKKITGILVNPTTGTVCKATIEKSLDSYYSALGCNCIDIISRQIDGYRVDIICDDEALLKAEPRPCALDNRMHPCLFGPMFIVAFDGVNDVTSLPDKVIRHILKRNVRRLVSFNTPKGFWPVIYPCNY